MSSNARGNMVSVSRSWLYYVEEIASRVAHHGLDDESKVDLEFISREARRLSVRESEESTTP